MTLISDLAATNDVAMAVAAELERTLGDDVILAVGLPRTEPPAGGALPDGTLRAVTLAGTIGEHEVVLTLFVAEVLAASLASRASDGVLATAAADALAAGLGEVARVAGAGAGATPATEADPAAVLTQADGEFLVYPLLEGSQRVATFVVRTGTARPTIHTDSSDVPATAVAVHDFQPLDGGAASFGDARPLTLLADVEMGVTAELGRRRMTVRELLSLTPGSVIELDRAAGTPVDVLVNGTLIARGEVVVIDEEFGIRVSEIVPAADTGGR